MQSSVAFLSDIAGIHVGCAHHRLSCWASNLAMLPSYLAPDILSSAQVTRVKLKQKQAEGIAEARSGRREPVLPLPAGFRYREPAHHFVLPAACTICHVWICCTHPSSLQPAA